MDALATQWAVVERDGPGKSIRAEVAAPPGRNRAPLLSTVSRRAD